jgi:uncharacterized membrane protein
LFGEKVIWTLG